MDPADDVDVRAFPTVHRLAAGLAEDRWQEEFQAGLDQLLDRVEMCLVAPGVRHLQRWLTP